MTSLSTEITTADRFAAAWTEMWNGSLDLAHELCAADFRIAFGARGDNGEHPGDALRGPADFIEFLRGYHALMPGVRFSIDGLAAGVFEPTGPARFACRWYADLPDGEVHSGIDLFETLDGKLTTVWSVTGQRRFPF